MTVKEVALAGGGPAEQHAALVQLAAGRRTAPSPAAAAADQQTASSPPQDAFNRAAPTAVVGNSGSAAGPTVASIASAASQSPGNFYVQTGAFSTVTNAERQRDLISSYGTTEIYQATAGGREVYRVRLGPYTTPDAAGIVADRLRRSGYGEARVVAN